MKNRNEICSNDLLQYDAFHNVWYVIQVSGYSGSSYMLKKLHADGTHSTIEVGSFKAIMSRMETIKESINASRVAA